MEKERISFLETIYIIHIRWQRSTYGEWQRRLFYAHPKTIKDTHTHTRQHFPIGLLVPFSIWILNALPQLPVWMSALCTTLFESFLLWFSFMTTAFIHHCSCSANSENVLVLCVNWGNSDNLELLTAFRFLIYLSYIRYSFMAHQTIVNEFINY